MSRPLIKKINSWANFENRVLEILSLALRKLRNEPSLPVGEDSVKHNSLNRRLHFCLRRAILEWEDANGAIVSPFPETNCKKVPDIDSEEITTLSEQKIPDFKWQFRNHSARDPAKSFIHYEIECKRLGSPTSSNWILNENYVKHGIFRFVNVDWCYGKLSRSGAMIGYIQNMNENDILIEVNNAALAACLTEIILSTDGWKTGDVSRLEQRLVRPDVPPTPFDLRHLWVDLRHHYKDTPTKSKNKSRRKRTARNT